MNFTLWGAGVSGGNRTVFQLCNGLSERGYDVSVTCLEVGGRHDWFGCVDADFRYVGLGKLQKAARKFLFHPEWDVDWGRRLAEAIPECDVNVATYCKTCVPVLWSGKGEPFYLVQHDESTFFVGVERNMAELTYQLPMQKLVVSEWLQERFGGALIGNGVDLSKFKDLGLERIYDAMVFDRDIRWKGDSLVVANALESLGYKVLVVKDFSEKELIEAYNRSKLFLFLSEKREGFGLGPLEAWACGCPVVATDCTDYIENAVNAVVLDGFIYHDIIEAVIKMVQVLPYTSAYKTLKMNGLEEVKSYSFEHVVDRFEEAIKK